MNLTQRFVTTSRTVIAEIEAADITNPDLPRPDLAALTTRATETLRAMTDHAERLHQAHDQLRAENAELERQVRALHEAAVTAAA